MGGGAWNGVEVALRAAAELSDTYPCQALAILSTHGRRDLSFADLKPQNSHNLWPALIVVYKSDALDNGPW